MKARVCVAILVASVVHAGDGGSRSTGSSDYLDETTPAAVELTSHVDHAFAARRYVQRAVWVDGANNIVPRPGEICVETSAVCADCAAGIVALDPLDPCGRAGPRIAF
jgi:hypothetical protein